MENLTKLNSIFISTDNLQFSLHLADICPEILVSVDYSLLGLLTVLIFASTVSEEDWPNNFTQRCCYATLYG